METKKDLIEELIRVIHPPDIAKDTVRKTALGCSKRYLRKRISHLKLILGVE